MRDNDAVLWKREEKVLLEDMGKQAYMSGKCFSKPKVMQKWLDLFRELMRE